MEKQIELNLNDDILYADACYKKLSTEFKGTHTSVHLFPSRKHKNKMYLGTRTHIYETEYTHDYLIDRDAAVVLYRKYKDIGCFNNEFRKYANE